jgi:hypothetical protein
MKKVLILTRFFRPSSNSPSRLPSSPNIRNSKLVTTPFPTNNEFKNMANLLEIYEKKLLNKEQNSGLIHSSSFVSKSPEKHANSSSPLKDLCSPKKKTIKTKEYNNFKECEIEKTLGDKTNKNFHYLFSFQKKNPQTDILKKRETRETFRKNCNFLQKKKNYKK